MANTYQNTMKGRLLALAELSDMFCIVKSNHILMSNGTTIVIPTDKDMKDGELAIYLNNLIYALEADDYEIDKNNPDLVDQLYAHVKNALIAQKSGLSQEEYDALKERIDTVQEALDIEIASYTQEQDKENAREIVNEAEQTVADILEQVNENRKQTEEQNDKE